MDTLRSVVAEDAALAQATVELARAGLQEPFWVFRPSDAPVWSNDARIGFEEDLTARIRRRTERPVIMEEGMEIKSFGITPRDAQMMDVRKWALSQVCNEYGVPTGLLGLDERPDVAAAQTEFYADVLPPYCESFTKMLNQRILVRIYEWTEGVFEFNLDEKLMGDQRIQTLVSASGRAVMLTNEARAKLNLPPVDGGDELVTPLNVLVGDNPQPSPQVMPVQQPGKPPQDGSYRVGQPGPTAPPPAKALEFDFSPIAIASGLTPSGYQPIPQLNPARGAELERQMRNIDTMKAAVQRHYTRLERSLRVKAAAADWQRWDREFAQDLDRNLHRVVGHEGELYAFKLGGRDFDMRRVDNYLGAMAAGAAGAINDTIKSEIDQLGLDDAIARAPQHIASAGASLGARATIWARDEAARQSPGYDQRVKTWVAHTERHAEFDGTTLAIGDEAWPAGFAPGGAPGCMCTMTIN
jgi:hypothetical protein